MQNTEAGSVTDLYGAAIPSETIAVQLDQMNVIKVSLRNTPLTLGTSVGGASTWSELVGKPERHHDVCALEDMPKRVLKPILGIK